MKSKIELVARAICNADGSNPDAESSPGFQYWESYIHLAQAAICAVNDADDFDMKFTLVRGQIHKRDCALVISKGDYGCDCKEEENNNG